MEILQAILDLLAFALKGVFAWARRSPMEALVLAFLLSRLFATTVHSGWTGVLYRFGRARRVLQPGWHWLIPAVETVVKLRSRAITLDLPPQRIAAADGLVYDASASLVYRVRDPMAALIEIDDVTDGCETAVALALYEVLGRRTQESMRDREGIDGEFTRLAAGRLARWGIEVDRAGVTNIAPTIETLRVTQIGLLARERATAVALLAGAGLSVAESLVLVGSERRLVSHAQARVRERARRRAPASALGRVRVRMAMGERAAAEEEMEMLLSDDWGDASLGEKALRGRGRAVIPLLRARARRVGDPERRGRLEGLERAIERRGKNDARSKER